MSRLATENRVDVLRSAAVLLERDNIRLNQRCRDLQLEITKLKGASESELAQRVLQLEEQIKQQQERIFGDSSERRPTAKPSKEHEQQTGHGPRAQPSLPIEEVMHELDDADKVCNSCGGQLEEWAGQFEESEEIDVIQRVIVLRKHKRKKYRCRCGSCIDTAIGPSKLLEGGRYSTNFAVEVAEAKYLDHAPLERQVRKFGREGLVIDSQTLWDQINVLAHKVEPIYDRLCEYLRSRPLIGIDETHWKLLGNNGGEHAQKRWQAWTMVCEHAVCYCILPSRSADAARKVLGSFSGIAIADGYSVYEHLGKKSGIVFAACWAHVRRKFFELQGTVEENLRDKILTLIGRLFDIDRETKDDIDSRRTRRDKESRTVIAEILDWLYEQKKSALPRSALGRAINYALALWPQLVLFLDDVRIPLDNNWSERALRGLVVGRKNHYGSKSERGTKVAAIFYTIFESAKLAGIDPRAYLREAVERSLSGEEMPLPHEIAAAAAT